MSQLINNALTGLVLAGTLKGYREEQRKGNDGNPWKQLFLGIEIPVTNGYKGQMNCVDVQVPERFQNAAFFDAVNKLLEKPVFVKVYVRAFATRSGAAYGFNLDMGDNSINDVLLPQSNLLSIKSA